MTPTTSPNTTGATSRTGTSHRNVWTVVLCRVTVLLEGYDLVVLGAIIPTLLKTHHPVGHLWGFYFFAAVAVAGFLAVLTLPGRAAAHAEATATEAAAEPAV